MGPYSMRHSIPVAKDSMPILLPVFYNMWFHPNRPLTHHRERLERQQGVSDQQLDELTKYSTTLLYCSKKKCNVIPPVLMKGGEVPSQREAGLLLAEVVVSGIGVVTWTTSESTYSKIIIYTLTSQQLLVQK